MKALTQSIATSARERDMAVAAGRAQTARMLQMFARDRSVMAETLKSGLVADRLERSVHVGALLAGTDVMCQQMHHDHVRMGHALRHGLNRSAEAVTDFVVGLRSEFAKSRAASAKAHRQMTAAQRAELARDRRERSCEVVGMLGHFHASHGEMARGLAEKLAKSTQETRLFVSGLNEWGRVAMETSRPGAPAPKPAPDPRPDVQPRASGRSKAGKTKQAKRK
jgi:hypothetical protein